MTSAPRALLVGFEAMDRAVAAEAIAQGRLPNLARLQREGLTVEMANPIGMLTGPVWASIVTGVHPDRHDRLNWRVLRAGTYRMEWLGPYSEPRCPPFWQRLAAHGLTSAVTSVPTIGMTDDPLVTQVLDWHTHDRRDPLVTNPPELGTALEERFGPVAFDTCDHQGAVGDLDALIARLRAEVDGFAEGVAWLHEQAPSDVVVAVCGVSHCAGHQLWHLHDPASPHHDPGERARLGDPMLDLYDRLDDALGRLLALADEQTVVMAILSHGMTQNAVLPHLTDPILRAIDDAMGPPGRVRWAREVARRTPNRVARLGLRLARRPVDRLAHIADGSRRFFPVENFPTHAAVRLNLVGREPNGRVRREDAAAVIDRLEEEVLAIRDVDTGRPVVRRVIRLAEHYEGVDTSGLADVLFEWTDDAVVERVTSSTIGTIERPYRQTRTGAHRPDGLWVLHGPGIPVGVRVEAQSVDVWPTLAALLGVEAGDVDGAVLPALRPSAAPSH